MKPSIGILLNRGILQRGIRGKPTFEKLALYAKAASRLGVDIVIFDPKGVDFKRGRIAGYVPTTAGAFRRAVVPLPKIVHKRGLFRSRRSVAVIRRLEARGVYVFNPQVAWDKYSIYKLLHQEPRLRPYLPESVPLRKDAFEWFRRRLEEGAEVFVKPVRGSLGKGIACIRRISPGVYLYQTSRRRRRLSLRAAWKLVRKGSGSKFLQRGIPLLEDDGRRVDFRVPVQKDGDNQWHVAGIAAKRAGRHAFLTNLAQGSTVHDGRQLLARHFGKQRADEILREIVELATLVARTIHARSPRMVDLGLDIGVDRRGRPYLIEVNRRDLRVLLRQSGQSQATEALYHNPVAYGRYVLENGLTG